MGSPSPYLPSGNCRHCWSGAKLEVRNAKVSVRCGAEVAHGPQVLQVSGMGTGDRRDELLHGSEHGADISSSLFQNTHMDG